MFCKNCGNEIKDNIKFCTKCGNENSVNNLPRKKKIFTKKRILFGLGGIAILAIIGFAIFIYKNSSSTLNSSDKKDQDIASSVVNIYCYSASGKDEDASGGSGTIITTDGLVLTNAHIIPQGKDASTDEKSCVVILPDPTTGASKEIYYAKPLVIPEISDKYDLAFVQIDDVYYDQAEGKAYGEYPKQFPAYDSDLYCKNENVKLGEPVRIYGYPAISGGFALTITDGVVSSLLEKDGLIITSAKISHGNSGGLAVDKNGCRIGIPSMVSSDDAESLGVIISNNLIYSFTDEVRVLLK